MDYIAKVIHAKSLDKMALYLRAEACKVAAGLICDPPEKRLASIKEADTLATLIENCNSLQQARKLLRKYGYAAAKRVPGRPTARP